MATLTSAHANATYPVGGSIANQSSLCVAWGKYNITTALSAADIVQMCRVPAGATVIGGYFQAKDLDTGTEAMDMDVGWADNGTDGASSAGLLNGGTMDGDAVNFVRPEAGNYYPFGGVLLTTGPVTFTKETIIQVLCNTAANAGGTGNMTVVVFYTMYA